MESTWTLFRVRGIPIGINWAWLFVFVLISWSLGAGLFPSRHPGLDPNVYIAMGLVAALLFFASILLHELGHAFQALKEDMQIDGITLWLLGGVARFRGMFPNAGAELRIAIAGPAVTLVIVGVFAALNAAAVALGVSVAITGVIGWLAWINGLVLGFNLVPALPLDGGRVLRAWLWGRRQSFAAATASAARAGRAFGTLLIGIGLLGFITGAAVGGLWFAVLGWFLIQAAQAEASFALLRQALTGMRARDLMTREPATVPPSLTILEFLDEVARTRGHSTYPVVDSYGHLTGLVSLRLAGQVSPEERHHSFVRDVMMPRDDVPVVGEDTDIIETFEKLQAGPGRAVVVDGDRIAGILSASDIARALELEEIRGTQEAKQGRGAGFIVWGIVTVMLLAAAGFLYRPPVAVVSPGEAIDVTADITIEGVEFEDPTGEYLLTAVAVRQPNAIGLGLAAIRGEQVIPLRALVPRDVEPEDFQEQQMQLFRESQRIAAAAAARAAGMDVMTTGTGARVVGVVQGSPAADALERQDVILAINGEEVRLVTDLQRAIRARPAGTRFTLQVERDGQPIEVEVMSTAIEGVEGDVGIGVFIETRDFDVALPFEVTFREREIGGPSAGLAYALAIYDMLDPDDLAQGRVIATSGTIDVDGRVGQVGGVDAKAEAALDQGADLFLVPAGEVRGARGHGIMVRGVATLEDAIATLRGGS